VKFLFYYIFVFSAYFFRSFGPNDFKDPDIFYDIGQMLAGWFGGGGGSKIINAMPNSTLVDGIFPRNITDNGMGLI
jgi:hypothetical protein